MLQQKWDALGAHERIYLLHTCTWIAAQTRRSVEKCKRARLLWCRLCGRLSRLGYSCRKPFPTSFGEMRKCKLERRHTRASSPPGDEAVRRSAWKRALSRCLKSAGLMEMWRSALLLVTLGLSRCCVFPAWALSYFVAGSSGDWHSAAQIHVATCLVCVFCRISNASSYLFFSGCVVVFVFRFVRFFHPTLWMQISLKP